MTNEQFTKQFAAYTAVLSAPARFAREMYEEAKRQVKAAHAAAQSSQQPTNTENDER